MNCLQWLRDLLYELFSFALERSPQSRYISDENITDSENIIRFNNGIYDLTSGEFVAMANENKQDALFYDYQKYANDAPEIIEIYEHLSKWFPDQEERDRCLIRISSVLYKSKPCQESLIFYGSGNNGKTLFYRLCQETFGYYRDIICKYECESPVFYDPSKFGFHSDLFIYECNELPEVYDPTKVIEFKSRFLDEPVEVNQFIRNQTLTNELPRLAPAFMYILLEHGCLRPPSDFC